jgi:hypothetical protein
MCYVNGEPEAQANAPYEVHADWFLQLLVDAANRSGVSLGITLSVGGILVSGFLEGGTEYFNGIAAEMETTSVSETDAAASFARAARSMGGRIYAGKPVADSESEEDEFVPPHFLHLRDARFFSPGGWPLPYNQGVWWRGRIETVSGFSLGILSGPRADEDG